MQRLRNKIFARYSGESDPNIECASEPVMNGKMHVNSLARGQRPSWPGFAIFGAPHSGCKGARERAKVAKE